MRRFISVCSMFVLAGVAGAHTLSDDAGTTAQVGHQLLGLHHLPLLVLLLVVGVVAVRACAESKAEKHRTSQDR